MRRILSGRIRVEKLMGMTGKQERFVSDYVGGLDIRRIQLPCLVPCSET